MFWVNVRCEFLEMEKIQVKMKKKRKKKQLAK